MIQYKRMIAKVLMLIMILSLVFPFITEQNIQGKVKKPKFSTKSITVKVKKSKTISIKNAKKAKFTWKSKNKKYATVKKAGKGKAKVKGVRKGKTKITCKVKVNKKTYNLTCKVKVIVPTKSSSSATPNQTATPKPNPKTPKPLYSPKPGDDPATLKGAYISFFENVGTCLRPNQLKDDITLAFVKDQYNSFTLENEMKPNEILGENSIQRITIADAKAKGYVIPSNYADVDVPDLNFDTVDEVLKIAYDNDLKMRAHTLIWHSQTPDWFFRTGYTGSTFVSKEVMDARMEFYIRTVMEHVYNSKYGKDVVYAWDVVNEYLHSEQPWIPDNQKNWVKIYGTVNTSPEHLKKAFTIAHNVLKQYNLENSVTLVYNDYDTYFVPDDTVKLINFINSSGKVCDGIGMQGHLDTARPTLGEVEQAVDKFIAAGFEIQITELDVTINYAYGEKNPVGHTDEIQAVYMGDLMKMLIKKRVAGADISGLTWWGLYDRVSWRASAFPLMFGTGITDPKPSFHTVIKAAADYWNSVK